MFKSHTLRFLFDCEFPFAKYLFDDKYFIFFWNWGIDRFVFDIRSPQKEFGCNLCLVMDTNFVLAEFLEGCRIIKEYQCNLLANYLDKCCFHPILLTWFLVVCDDEVTKILRNNLFIFYFVLPILPCKQKTRYRKSRNQKRIGQK